MVRQRNKEEPLQSRGPRLGRVGLFAYNCLYWPYLLGSCILLFLPALLLFLVTLPFDRKKQLLHAYTCLWGGHYLSLAPFASVEVNRPTSASGACIFVSNHQSMVDILAVFATRLRFLWVSKVENFYVPFLGWNMLLNGYIPLRRGYLPSIMRMVRKCIRKISDGHSLFVFPEGTRSPDGHLLPFFPGAFRIAVRGQVPIVPVVLSGTASILKKHSLTICPGPVVVHVLPPMYPKDHGNDWKQLREAVRARMTQELDSMHARPGVSARSASRQTVRTEVSVTGVDRAS